MKKLKRLMLTFVVIALTIGVSLGNFTFTGFAAFTPTHTEVDVSGIPATVEYGTSIIFDAPSAGTVSVTTPSGATREVPPADGTGDIRVPATEIGYYTFKIANASAAYYNDFKVRCVLTRELSITLPYGGATIPTRIQNNVEIQLPTATATFINDDGERETLGLGATPVITVSIAGPDPAVTTDYINANDLKFTPTKAGTYIVRYTLMYGGASDTDGYNIFKDFEIIVQDHFTDTNIPVLNLSIPSSSANINTKVTLPKATATDDFDKNVKISVKVFDRDENEIRPDGAVVDKRTGYATGANASADKEFDNDFYMSFYPLILGDYTVVYQAFDDAYPTPNKSAPIIHTIKVKDELAPVIEAKANEFPAKWGKTVKDENGVTDNKFYIGYPDVYDNSGNVKSVEFYITKPDGTQLVKFNNILEILVGGADTNGPGRKATVNSKNFVFSEDGLQLVVNDVLTDGFTLDDMGASATGNYTFTFKATDAANKSSTKQFTVNFMDEFEDATPPSVTMGSYPAFLSVAANKETAADFNIPAPSISDSDAADRIFSEQILVLHGAANTRAEYTLIDQYNKKVEVLKLYDGFELIKVGETAPSAITFSNYESMEFKATARDNAGNVTVETGSAIRLLPSNFNANFSVTSAGDMGNAAYENGTISPVGVSLTIDPTVVSANFVDSVGVEFTFYNKDGALVDYYHEYTRTINVGDTSGTIDQITIDNIKFRPTSNGEQTMVIRVFDLAGNNCLNVYTFNAEGQGGSVITSAATAITTGEANKAISLVRYKCTDPVTGIEVTKFASLTMKGFRSELMGYQFTAKSQKRVYNYSYELTDMSGKTEITGANSFTSTAAATGSLKLLGSLPIYVALNTVVVIPLAVADEATETAKISYDVVDVEGNKVTTSETASGSKQYKFTASKDGKYTINFKQGSNTVFSYTVSCGNITPAAFKILTEQRTINANSKFQFAKLEITDNTSVVTDLTIVKTLYGPDKSQVARVTGTGTPGLGLVDDTSNAGYTLSTPGTYTVTYTITDKAKNVSEHTVDFTVLADSGATNWGSMKVFSTVLIIAGVLLIVGVIVYLIRFRRIKE